MSTVVIIWVAVLVTICSLPKLFFISKHQEVLTVNTTKERKEVKSYEEI